MEVAAAVGHPNMLRDAVVYLAAAITMVPLFHRLKLGTVLGYLVAGMLIGPQLLGLVADPESTLAFSEFGIVLLLFVIGLELRPRRLWSLRADIFGLGFAQVALSGLAITGFILYTTGFTWQAALAVGLPLALSSTALVVQLLQERGELNTRTGERSFAVLLFQDLSIVPLLTIVAALSRAPVDLSAPIGWELAANTAIGIAVLALAGRFILNPLFRLMAQIGAREAFVVAALFTVLGAAFLMTSLGVSMALGAFVAGVMLADSPYRHEVEADIEPFRGLLLGLFFIAVGMSLDLFVILERWPLILLLVGGLMAIKLVIIGVLARAFGSPWPRALGIGLLLSQGGEFGFVLFRAAEHGALIAGSAADLFAAVVTISMALTPIVVALVDRFAMRAESADGLDGPETSPPSTVVIVGYGRFGQTVAQMLMARGVPVTLIDRKPGQIELSGQFGSKVYYGDGTRIDVLRASGADTASLVVFCTDGNYLSGEALRAIRAAFPHLKVLARAYDRRHYLALKDCDCDVVVREVFDSAVRMGREALKASNVDDAHIDIVEAEYRRRDNERLALQMASGDIRAGMEMTFRPDRPLQSDALGEIPYAEPQIQDETGVRENA
jgi:monovalent cation:proton antiporter-2 (CPA2) family protein